MSPFQLNLKKPLVIYDLETTGINITQDRIVEIAMVKVFPDGRVEEKCKRINPTIPIPEESSKIHGIYDKDVKDEPTFAQIAKSLKEYIKNCDLGGFNCNHFDLPLLVEEFYRSNIEFDLKSSKIIDVQQIFHMMEKRNLTAAYQFYCNKELVDAHSALGDARATYEVLVAQIQRYEGKEIKNGDETLTFQNNTDMLHKLRNNKLVDLAGRMIYKNGEEIFNFGKYKGKNVKQVFQKEPSYYTWMMEKDFSSDTKKHLLQIYLKSKEN